MFPEAIESISNSNILAIIGEDEVIQHKDFLGSQEETVWISICDLNREHVKIENNFDDILKMKFMDIENGWTKTLVPISKEQGQEIKSFILKNKNKRFLINCQAGQSRSAAIGLAVEFLLGDFEKWSHFTSSILKHERYFPNYYVLSSILGFEVKNPSEEENIK